MSTTYIALLRGINVGGKHKVPMKDLVDVFASAGCGDVRTYIQSGNVVFRADPPDSALLSSALGARIAERFGFPAPVILRTAGELAAVLTDNPYVQAGAAEESLHVLFLDGIPDPVRVATLDPERSAPDTFVVAGREIYLCLPSGAGNTRLTNAYFDRQLAVVSTQRNARTVAKLAEMARSG